jgi:hypothetical protein
MKGTQRPAGIQQGFKKFRSFEWEVLTRKKWQYLLEQMELVQQ